MTLKLISQPQGTFRLGDFLNSALASSDWTAFRAAIAFVKRSGTKHIKTRLEEFSRRGDVCISVGIDSGGTSFEGLSDLITALASRGRLSVFHNASPSTFHPKIYLFKNATAAEVVIGSGNMTEGGLFTNYEASVLARLDLAIPEHRAFLASVEMLLDTWSTPTEHLCYPLTDELLKQLVAKGHVLDETKAWGGDERRGSEEDRGALFKSHPVPHAPRIAGVTLLEGVFPDDEQEPEDDQGLVVPTPAPAPGQAGKHNIFLMTLQKTDVGIGQTNTGTQRRSPEIFIPLVCRDYDPEFWGWPNLFVPDPTWTSPLDRDGRGKMDRSGVMVSLGGEIFPVHIWYNPEKRDQRLRSEHIRRAGTIDDILYIERSDGKTGFTYYIEVVPQGTAKHAEYLALCAKPVRNSKKKWTYI